jgi:hypothetical protein
VRERRGGRADFGNDLLRGVSAQPGDFGEALHRLMVSGKQIRHLPIELAEVSDSPGRHPPWQQLRKSSLTPSQALPQTRVSMNELPDRKSHECR